MNVNPKEIIEKGIITGIDNYDEQMQPNGIDLRVAQDVDLKPKSFINVLLKEKINVPQDMVAILQVRSSFSRKGVFTSSGLWDSNYSGVTGCSIYNMGNGSIHIKSGTRIGQMVFFRSEADKKYEGHYKDNNNINSKLEK